MNTMLSALDDRTLTELDSVRLRRWIRHTEFDSAPYGSLEELLDLATVVPGREVRPDIVTMYSQVVLRMLPSGRRQTLTVCYPDDAEPAAGFVSVLTPVGSALLGLPVGATARWHTPDGAPVEAEIDAIPFQPEASGDYTL